MQWYGHTQGYRHRIEMVSYQGIVVLLAGLITVTTCIFVDQPCCFPDHFSGKIKDLTGSSRQPFLFSVDFRKQIICGEIENGAMAFCAKIEPAGYRRNRQMIYAMETTSQQCYVIPHPGSRVNGRCSLKETAFYAGNTRMDGHSENRFILKHPRLAKLLGVEPQGLGRSSVHDSQQRKLRPDHDCRFQQSRAGSVLRCGGSADTSKRATGTFDVALSELGSESKTWNRNRNLQIPLRLVLPTPETTQSTMLRSSHVARNTDREHPVPEQPGFDTDISLLVFPSNLCQLYQRTDCRKCRGIRGRSTDQVQLFPPRFRRHDDVLTRSTLRVSAPSSMWRMSRGQSSEPIVSRLTPSTEAPSPSGSLPSRSNSTFGRTRAISKLAIILIRGTIINTRLT